MTQPDGANAKKATVRVAVVAAGVVSPLGFGLTETLDSLRNSRDCVSPVRRFSVEQCRCKTAGQIPDDQLLAAENDALRPRRRLHRASHMMIQALNELLTQQSQFKPELTVIGTTSGGMSYGEDYYRSVHQAGKLRHAPTWIANYPAQKPVIDAQEAFGISSPCQVIANACASGTNAIGHAFECVRSGRYKRVLAGGYDALSEMVFVGFDSLQASTPDKCRPFDRNDTAEGKAISSLFNGVPVSSTKGMMGHSLGAAGAIEAIVCLLALQHQLLPPNINFATLDDNLDLNIVANEARPAVLHTALSNSFGFGGTNASILMRRSHRRQEYGGPAVA